MTFVALASWEIQNTIFIHQTDQVVCFIYLITLISCRNRRSMNFIKFSSIYLKVKIILHLKIYVKSPTTLTLIDDSANVNEKLRRNVHSRATILLRSH